MKRRIIWSLKVTFVLICAVIMISCTNEGEGQNGVKKILFGKLENGREVYIYTLTNVNGIEVKLIEYGAAVFSIMAPDRNGNLNDIVIGFGKLEEFVAARTYFGSIVGRYGNRIAQGKFTLDGVEYQLTINDGENHLHGGKNGFDQKLWSSEIIGGDLNNSVKFSYVSEDGEEGYPGTLTVEVVYTLLEDNSLKLDYSLSSDRNTIANVTNHTYFNLTGDPEKDILNHELQINADNFTPVRSGLIPTGEILSVKDTPMDFAVSQKIGSRIENDYEQLILGYGYDHNWVLNGFDGNLNFAATLYDQESGRTMEVWTTEPGIQFYSGNFLDGSAIGKSNKRYNHRTGLCLETQHYPDSPNHPNFPSTQIKAGEIYKSTTIYRFSVR